MRTTRIVKRIGMKAQLKVLEAQLNSMRNILIKLQQQAYKEGYDQAVLDKALPTVYNQDELVDAITDENVNRPDDQFNKGDHA